MHFKNAVVVGCVSASRCRRSTGLCFKVGGLIGLGLEVAVPSLAGFIGAIAAVARMHSSRIEGPVMPRWS